MQSVQQKHIISIKDQDPLLIGSGVEKMAPYMISDEFAFKAKEDGKVESIDYKNEVAILKYKSGKTDLIDLSTYECCNSNGGLNKGFTLNTFNCWNILILNKDNQQRSFLIIKEERSTTIEKYNFIYYTK